MKAALIGLGMIADKHADAIAATDGAVVLDTVMARRAPVAEEFASRHGVPHFCTDIDAVIARNPDFVIVLTPPDARTDLHTALLAAKIPVLMEKPLERTAGAARDLVEQAEAADVPFGVVLQHRARLAASQFAELVSSGELGTIGMVDVQIPWWRPQSYYDELGRGTYARDGGGVLITQAIHTIDLMLTLTGPVARVQAMARRSPLHQMEAEDVVAAGLDFASGAVGMLTATTASYPGGRETITLHGTKATASLSAATLTVTDRDGRVKTIEGASQSGGGADPTAFTHEWHQTIITEFAEDIAAERALRLPARAALDVHYLIDALQLSSHDGRAVDLEDLKEDRNG
jgi:UDP-N-acetyl-2-amino-2-deoxyglucuronate dehydrogenase